MRALLPDRDDHVDVAAHYATGWVETGGFRANMIASADGAAQADGLSAGLQTPGDNRVFAVLRELADAVLVGSTTAQAERYRPVRPGADAVRRRAARGFAAELPVVLVSRSLRLDLDAPLFADNRPLVVTTADADPGAIAGRAEVIVCGHDDIDYARVRAELLERGLTRVLCEGGPTILGRMLAEDALDELCLSVSPLATGPGAGRIVAGVPWPLGPRHLRLGGLLEEDGALFARYLRA